MRLLYFIDFDGESTLSGPTIPIALFMVAMLFLGLGRPDYLRSGGYPGFQHFLGIFYVYFLFVFLLLFNKVIGQPLSQRGLATALLLPFSKCTVICEKFVVAWCAGFGIFASVLSLKWLLDQPLLSVDSYFLELALISCELFLLTAMWTLIAFGVRGLLPAILVEFASAFALETALGSLGTPLNQLSVTFGEPVLYYSGQGQALLGVPAAATPLLVPFLGGAVLFLVALLYVTRWMEVD